MLLSLSKALMGPAFSHLKNHTHMNSQPQLVKRYSAGQASSKITHFKEMNTLLGTGALTGGPIIPTGFLTQRQRGMEGGLL